MKDLVILVPDKNTQYALKGALSRPEALGIRPISFEFRVHTGRDGGVRKSGPELIALDRRQFKHALLLLDYEGSGTESPEGTILESELDRRLSAQWKTDAKAIVIEPELDVWIWGGDNAIEAAIDWPGAKGIRDWLAEQGFAFQPNGKPIRPKEAIEMALRVARLPRSSSLYQSIATKLSVRHCADEAFLRLRHQLRTWFPNENTA
jgi:hypothetical protein